MAVADLNRDGVPDLTVTAKQVVHTLINQGNGTFPTSQQFEAGATACALQIADLDGDSNPDALMADASNGHVFIELGFGNGGLEVPPLDSVGDIGNNGAAVADFNNDGKLDVVTAAYFGHLSQVALGKGDGTFNVTYGVSLPDPPTGVTSADMNLDGNQDVISSWQNSGGGVGVALGNGDGTMQPSINANTPANCIPGPVVAIGNVNADGFPDVVLTCSNTVTVLPGNGNGTLSAPVVTSLANSVGGVALVDFNGDQILDAICLTHGGAFATLVGNGNGTFQTPVMYSLPFSYIGVPGVGDLNADGYVDTVIALNNNTLAVALGQPGAIFGPVITYPLDYQYYSGALVLSDINSDGFLDAAVGGDGSFSILLGTGTGSFSMPLVYAGNPANAFAGTGDFNNDGRLDVIIATAFASDYTANYVTVNLETGCLR